MRKHFIGSDLSLDKQPLEFRPKNEVCHLHNMHMQRQFAWQIWLFVYAEPWNWKLVEAQFWMWSFRDCIWLYDRFNRIEKVPIQKSLFKFYYHKFPLFAHISIPVLFPWKTETAGNTWVKLSVLYQFPDLYFCHWGCHITWSLWQTLPFCHCQHWYWCQKL